MRTFSLARSLHFHKGGMMKRAILLFLLFILMPSACLMVWYYLKTSAILERDMSSSMLQTLKQAEYNLSARLDQVANISDGLIGNPDIRAYLDASSQPSYRQYEIFQTMENSISSAERNRDIRQIRMFVEPGLLFSDEGIHFFPLSAVENTDWYRAAMARNGAIYWRSTFSQPYLASDPADVISAVRILHDPRNYDRTAGMLSIDVPEANLRSIIDKIQFTPSQQVWITDRAGKIVSHHDPSLIGQQGRLTPEQLLTAYQQQEGFFAVEGHPNAMVLFRHIPSADFMIVAEVPMNEVSGESLALTRISAVILLAVFSMLFIFILVVAFAYAAERVNRRVRELILTLKREGVDNLETGRQGNFQDLELGVARMVQTVHDLTSNFYQEKIRARDAQLKALQAQINPHFLYNTLDSIHWMAIRRNADEISHMIESLSTYFRQSLNKGRDVVLLEEELLLIRSYMHIQNTRNDNGIQLDVDIHPEALACYIPKMILQPLVENAVLHGIHQKRPKHGAIRIAADVQDSWLRIQVSDDGVGIPGDRIAALLTPPMSDTDVQSFGLYNVHERVKLISQNDPDSGVAITSIVGVGTQVSIAMKAVTTLSGG
ncbi:sensor histidine kinase [Paenibacillus oryzisoli]|uniref:sensor histidine kinase n=1 Tax=Paenibacillus oryzisoli TaxID=1850517 RepID=UPI003D275436